MHVGLGLLWKNVFVIMLHEFSPESRDGSDTENMMMASPHCSETWDRNNFGSLKVGSIIE